MARRYQIFDVFTDTKLTGNPLAVVLDSDDLDEATMQAIAREFNLSETVFITAPHDPVNTAAVRIFTPVAELPFAGHPTVGAAIALAAIHAPDLIAREDVGVVLEEAIGTISCSVRHRRGEAAHARFEVPRLAERWSEPRSDVDLAGMLGLAPEEVGFGSHRPTCFTAGNAMTFVPIVSVDALGRARLASSNVKAIHYLYTPDIGAAPNCFRTRMLSNGYGVPEDPATGSAAAAFPGAIHANERLADGEHDCRLHQGVELGRPSRIGVAFTIEAGRLTSTAVGGSAVMIAQGALSL